MPTKGCIIWKWMTKRDRYKCTILVYPQESVSNLRDVSRKKRSQSKANKHPLVISTC